MKDACRRCFQKVSEYLDGELEREICEEVEAHLRECPQCSKCYDSLRKTIQLCREGAMEEIPQDVHRRLRSAILECLEKRAG